MGSCTSGPVRRSIRCPRCPSCCGGCIISDAFASIPKWGGVKEVVLSGLCEDGYLIDLSCASTTGLYDITTRQWDPEALQLAGIVPSNWLSSCPPLMS